MNTVDGIAASDVGVQIETLLIEPLLAPIVDAMGGASAFGAEAFAREIARRIAVEP